MACELQHPADTLFSPLFRGFSPSSLFLPDDQVAKSGRHFPLYSDT
jgi:hypothetical protein